MLDAVIQLTGDLERLGLDPRECNTAAVGAIVQLLGQRTPTRDCLSDRAQLFGFPRRYLHATAFCLQLCAFLHHVAPSGSGSHVDAVGSATFQQVIESAGIQVFDNLPEMTSEQAECAFGASFEVTIARALNNSSLPPYRGKGPSVPTKCRQWKRNALLVLKKPKLSGLFDPCASLDQLRGKDASNRISRTVINELLILSHPPLRNHRNIVHLFGIAWDKNNSAPGLCPVLVQSCADQGNLDHYLVVTKANGKLTWPLRCDIIGQILTGLRDLHACGIVHGDIKSLNILVATTRAGQSKPRILLSDFGFSIISQEGQQVEPMGATLRYASPEMYRCLKSTDHTMPLTEAFASDVYSFGLVACAITLGLHGANDVFEKVKDLEASCAAYNSDVVLDPGSEELQSDPGLWEKTKVDQAAHWVLVQSIMLLVDLERAFSGGIGLDECDDFMDSMKSSLTWSPAARFRDLSGFIESLKAFLPRDGSAGSGLSGLPL
jgi:serine/threonine protein kinase